MTAMSSLKDEISGRFLLRTQSGSRYWLDLDRREMCRMPVADDPALDHRLRRDGDTVRVLRLVECTIGRGMHLLIDLAVPGVAATSRRTTPVMAIERVALDLSGAKEASTDEH